MARALGFLTCFIILWVLIPNIKGQPAVGYVLEIRGVWYLNANPSDTLRQGQKLPAASIIRAQSPSRNDTITVADMRGAILVRRDCATNCLSPIRLPASPAKPTLVGGIFQAAMDWLWGSPDRYVAVRSRGDEMSDGIAKLVDGKIDLSSLLHVQGKYHLRWRLLAANQKVEPANWSEAIELNPIVSFSKFRSGIYEFEVLRRVGSDLEVTSSAWVLVVLPEAYVKTKEAYDQAVTLTKHWENKVTPDTMQTFLRAHLDEISRSRIK